MGGHIPHSIKVKVIESWIDGVPRDDISTTTGIGGGTVSKIVKEASSNIVDIVLLRALSKQLRKDGVTTSHFASAVRLSNRLKRLGLSVEDMDSLVELMDVHCFKTEQTVLVLISKVEEVSKIAVKSGVSINRLSEYIIERLDKKMGLESEITSLENRLTEEFKKTEATQKDLDEYRENRHKLTQIKELEDKIKQRDQEIEKLKIGLEQYKRKESRDAGIKEYIQTEIVKFNEQFSADNPLDVKELEGLLGEIHYDPCRYPQLIKYLRDYMSLSDQKR